MAGAVQSENRDVGLVLGPDRALGEPRSLALGQGSPARASSSASTSAPEWIMVLPLGRVADDPERVEVRDWRPDFRVRDAQALVDEFNSRAERDGPTVIDRNHAELWSWFQTDTPAAGWLHELEVREDGIYGRSTWTPRGKQEVVDGEYGYTSSVVVLKWATNSEGQRDHETPPEVARITGLSLCNTPATYTKWLSALRQQPAAYMAAFGLSPYSHEAAEQLRRAVPQHETHQRQKAADGSGARGRVEPAAAVFSSQPGSAGQGSEAPSMTRSANPSAAELALERLGLSADASADDVDAAITRLGSVPGEVVADLSRQVGALTQDAEQRRASERDRRIDSLLDGALAAGRLTPAGVEVYRDLGKRNGPELLGRVLDALPAARLDQREGKLELGERTPAGGDDYAAFAVHWGLSASQMNDAVRLRDQLPEPRLLDPNSVDYGDAVKVGA